MTSKQKTNTHSSWLRIIAAKQMAAEGRTREQIADRLGMSAETVKDYTWRYEDLFRYNDEFRELAIKQNELYERN